VCDKIDTNNLEFVGLSAPNSRWPWSYAGTGSYTVHNPLLRLRSFENNPYQLFDGNNHPETYEILYSNEPHNTLIEQRDDACDDDANGDGVVNIKYLDGTGISDPSFPIDWYEDASQVDDGV